MDKLKEIKELDSGLSYDKYKYLEDEHIEWLIKQAEENVKLKEIIAQCRCEECGNEVGDNTEFSYGILCKDCVPYELDI